MALTSQTIETATQQFRQLLERNRNLPYPFFHVKAEFGRDRLKDMTLYPEIKGVKNGQPVEPDIDCEG